MKMKIILLLFAALLIFCEPIDASGIKMNNSLAVKNSCSAEQVFQKISEMLKNVSESVVKITVSFKDKDGSEKIGFGTGFFIANNNNIYVVVFSAGHLIGDKGEYEARRVDLKTKKETSFSLKLLAHDLMLDFSVFSFDYSKLNFKPKPLELADVERGQAVWSVGYPGGIYLLYTAGYVSDILTFDGGRGLFGDYIFHSAPISGGNSGGPLVNVKGEVVGINIAMMMTSQNYQSMSFARPSKMIKEFLSTINFK